MPMVLLLPKFQLDFFAKKILMKQIYFARVQGLLLNVEFLILSMKCLDFPLL